MQSTRFAIAAVFVAIFAALFSAVFTEKSARAQSAAPPTDAEVGLSILEEEELPRRVALEVYPLDLLLSRFGFGAEAMPAPHHALVLNGYYVSASDTNLAQQTFGVSGVGAEVGYRFYSASTGLRGFFAGPSFLVGAFNAHPPGAPPFDFRHVGAAFDVGYQAVIDHVVLGLGFGAQFVHVSSPMPDFGSLGAASIANSGLRPRALATIGWAF